MAEQHHHLHLADLRTRPRVFRSWERVRHRQAHWAIECIAEMMGVFFYCYAGVGATAPYVLGNILKLEGVGSLLTIGFSYALGIVMALVVASGTSGGHFNPAVTIVWVLFKGFPVAKGARYIVAQILGGYLTCLIIYWQYKTLIQETEQVLQLGGVYDTVNFTAQGPAGIFALYVSPTVGLGLVWVNEFIADFFIGLVIFTCLDVTNFLAPPIAGPWLVGFAYAVAIWAYSPNGLAANAARDVGGRLAAITIWGTKAGGGSYAAIAALTNIPATILSYLFYEIVFTDSSRSMSIHRVFIPESQAYPPSVVTAQQKEFLAGHKAHQEHKEGIRPTSFSGSAHDLEEKGGEERRE
ncbi:aquaporin-like protein [Artomyces pyxidatus]|uniref:Aquaporin-like protein n=1 Tax=Artomyces pyxidatus TaxID=48021 RepID=A0ACB8TAB0_9AGAM|nr:aquaporin-like protein [Artomyces pyxidatus]